MDPWHGSFGVRVILGERLSVSSPFGHRTLIRSGAIQIKAALQAIDEYCRLLLPDKYLDALEAAIGRTDCDQRSSADEESRGAP